MPQTNQQISELLTRGVEKVIIKEHLEKRLLAGEKLRLKFGIDPTGSKIHLGHTVIMRKLRQFQQLGHTIIFLIGDFTARIGDPTGRIVTRPPLSDEQIKKNMSDYQKQASVILDMSKTEVRYNSEWWKKMSLADMLILVQQVTYSQVSARKDFKKRISEDVDFTLEEFLYPVLQGYDSVALKCDVEIGGTDQEFNMLMGRRMQKHYGQPSQDVLTCPLLLGIDGRKMSKSYDNYIAVTDEPCEMYGKVMSATDEIIIDYYKLVTDVSIDEIDKIARGIKDGSLNPRDAKAWLAREIVSIYHSKGDAIAAEKEFEQIFKDKGRPSKVPRFKTSKLTYLISDLLTEAKLATSKAEAKRLVEQGGVKIDDKIIDDWQTLIKIRAGMIVQVGKRRFMEIAV